MFQGFQVLHIPDMLTDKGVPIPCETEGVFQFGTAGQDRTGEKGQFQRKRGIPSRSPNGLGHRSGLSLLIGNGRNKPDAVIVSGIDLPIVKKEPVSEVAETFPRFCVVLCDGLFGEIPTGHDKRAPNLVQQEVMKGRVGQA